MPAGLAAPWPAPRPWRHRTARALRALARHLLRIAHRLGAAPARTAPLAPPQVEFHAEAGAPEGALYVDGRLVGYLDTRRL
ncbi:hypothetical protein G3A44_15975 [Ideonella sp. TBM-1]|uniref:Uncharacterized protein n=1 Tax=Ideonella livida TaxID=2707176 RepID=A0A7C9PIQ2_9BURK|nr:hypothetical protein [Ideonella livida]